jgi:hypothetical protein
MGKHYKKAMVNSVPERHKAYNLLSAGLWWVDNNQEELENTVI